MQETEAALSIPDSATNCALDNGGHQVDSPIRAGAWGDCRRSTRAQAVDML